QPQPDGRVQIAIRVHDTGIGITADQIQHIFQPFVQADSSTTRRYGGSGLGLAISRQLAELMGGHLEVLSTPQVGSTFTLTLTMRPSDPQDGYSAPPLEWPSALRHQPVHFADRPLRVLIAEDNPINQTVTLHLLERLGCQADVTANGVEALAAVIHAPYDVVLMDVEMPELDGEQTTRAIRTYGEMIYQPYIVALTAHALADDRDRAIAAGMNAYLSKPVQLEDLRVVLARALNYHTILLDQSPPPVQSRAELPPPPDVPLIDWNALAALEAGLGENPREIMRNVLQLWRDELRIQIAMIDAVVAERDRNQIATIARSVADYSRYLGAYAIAVLCDMLEQQALINPYADLNTLVSRIHTTYSKSLKVAISSYPQETL
ncbi:MAG: response regulator, partial [Oscillochloris sp.]|nr:response regulator [Oscillochloris sp.]